VADEAVKLLLAEAMIDLMTRGEPSAADAAAEAVARILRFARGKLGVEPGEVVKKVERLLNGSERDEGGRRP